MTNHSAIQNHNDLKHLRTDVERLQGDLGKLLTNVSAATQGAVGEMEEKAKGQLHNLVAQVGQTYQKVREKSGAMRIQVEKTVEERPITSLMVAFGVGAAIGTLTTLVARR